MKIQFSTTIIILFSLYGQAQNKIYFDQNWNETSKENASYYRPMPLKKVGELFFMQDFYMNGQLQFQGYIYQNDESKYAGDAFWYSEDGFDSGETQFINLSNQKELTYYDENGSVWKKIQYNQKGEKSKIIVYLKGKELAVGEISDYKYSGVFSPNKPNNYYQNPFDNAYDEEPQTVDGVNLNSYSEVVFWVNGKKAFQTDFERYSNLGNIYWNKLGKEIYNSESENKTILKQYYYTKNGFASEIKSHLEITISNDDEIRLETNYDSNGIKISVLKTVNFELEEEIVFINGKESVLKYKKEKPFDGEFNYNIGKFNRVFALKNGIFVGEAITRNTETGEIVAQGDYINGKPNNGTFFEEDQNTYSIKSYKNQLQDGIQQSFKGLSNSILLEEFEMIAGKRHGFYKKTKDNGDILSCEFKEDKPYEGVFEEANNKYFYEAGNLTRKDSFAENSEELLTSEIYKNNQISTILFFFFQIPTDIQEIYKGIFKDQKPYDGYFIGQNQDIEDLIVVDFYEKGNLKYKYSSDIFESENNFERTILSNKAIYKDHKITDGFEYTNKHDNTILGLGFKNGKINKIELNLFAMHYFNQFTFELNENKFLFNELKNDITIKSAKVNEVLITQIIDSEGKLLTNSGDFIVEEGAPNAVTLYSIKDNTLQSIFIDGNHIAKLNQNTEENIDRLTLIIYSNLMMNDDIKLQDFFDALVYEFKNNNITNYKDLFISENFSPIYSDRIGGLYYNSLGKPQYGIDIKKVGNEYEIILYGNENQKETKKAKTLDEVKEIVDKFNHFERNRHVVDKNFDKINL
ncbi:hypothetical protein [Flavobacterium sp. I3-2]|uniref:hypothetical protein n=1 Tax=Flavobacterium sp. I3-2 TaxID=2748319 RepID=UPI0015A81D49|nr:hypothetical protein [Flavobacterium sp. I3-2]